METFGDLIRAEMEKADAVVQEKAKQKENQWGVFDFNPTVDEQLVSMINRVFGEFGLVGGMNGSDGFIFGPNRSVNDHVEIAKTNKVTYDPKVKFSYYGDISNCNGHDGIIVIANYVDETRKVVHYGIAYCSPEDVYSKTIGKSIAFSDMDQNMWTVALTDKNHHSINANIFCNLVASDDAPSWAKDKVAFHAANHIDMAFGLNY